MFVKNQFVAHANGCVYRFSHCFANQPEIANVTDDEGEHIVFTKDLSALPMLTITTEEKELLQAALYEYIGNRGPTSQEYVARRYDNEAFSPEWKARKVESVERNKKVALKLRERLFQ